VASTHLPSARPLVVVAIVCLAAVGAALVSQHYFDMQPCPWCVLQRVIFVAIAVVCLIGAAIPAVAGRVGAALLVELLALCGVAAALWQHFKAAASASCNLTLADKIISALQLDSLLPDVFAPRASCADAAVNLFGVPYDFWSLALFVLCAIAALSTLRARA
jgi:disulfide bond formation protein DsbB